MLSRPLLPLELPERVDDERHRYKEDNEDERPKVGPEAERDEAAAAGEHQAGHRDRELRERSAARAREGRVAVELRRVLDGVEEEEARKDEPADQFEDVHVDLPSIDLLIGL